MCLFYNRNKKATEVIEFIFKSITLLNKHSVNFVKLNCKQWNQVRLPYRRGHTVLRQSLPQKTEHVLFVRMTDTQVEDDDGDYALFARNLIHLGYKSKMSSTIQTQKWEWGWILKNTLNFEVIDWVATVAETWVQCRSDIQNDSRVLKKVLTAFSFIPIASPNFGQHCQKKARSHFLP